MAVTHIIRHYLTEYSPLFDRIAFPAVAYLTKLLENKAVERYLRQRQPEV